MIEFKTLNLKKWTVLAHVSDEILNSVVLVHVFGYEAESAYLVTSKDEVFAVGENILGRLGSVHALALTKNGEIYAWGNNNFGQLGHGSPDTLLSPNKIIFPDDEVKIKHIATADRYSLALSSKNELYHWGDVTWDCCSKQTEPTLLTINQEPIVIDICCGAFHAAALTDNGKVLTWGVNETGQLGNGNKTLQDVPQFVGGQLEDQVVLKIVCSTLATVALTDEGILYAWGHNENSSLAVGLSMDAVCFPQRVIFRKNIIEIAANNLQPVLCAEADEPHEVFLWGLEDEEADHTPKSLPCSNILEAFYGISMPMMRRRSENIVSPVISSLQGPARDIGKALFNIKDFSDLQIELSDGIVYVHTVIMRAFCDHFKTLLDENWSKGRWRNFFMTVINMTQYNAKAYRSFLKYVYTGVLEPLEGTEIIALCDIAMSYLELELKSLCQKMFKYCLNVSNVAQLYALAAGDQSELVESCIQFTSENLESVVLSKGFESLDPVLSKSLICSAVKLKHGLL